MSHSATPLPTRSRTDQPKCATDTGYDVVIVGGGLAGLTAAATFKDADQSVLLLERSSELGGRGGTREEQGFQLNWGPHALYRRHIATKILRELGVRFSGKSPNASGGYAIYDGRRETLPGGLLSLLSTGLLGVSGKLELAKLLAGLPKLDSSKWVGRTVREFLDREIHDERVRLLFCALIRLTSYTNACEVMCAGAALDQLRLGLAANVTYLDGGWQVLIDGLADVAQQHGVTIRRGVKVNELEPGPNGFTLSTNKGDSVSARSVILALPPAAASALTPEPAKARLESYVSEAPPVRAACLDLALSALPRPRALFALGVDQPVYFSVHSTYADLAPQGGAVIHAARYLSPNERDSNGAQNGAGNDHPNDSLSNSGGEDASRFQTELEEIVDLVQPGWRNHVVTKRYLPNIAVTGATVMAKLGGLDGRPSPTVEDVPGLFLAGDWVGPRGMLADAAVGSGYDAAREALKRLPRSRENHQAATVRPPESAPSPGEVVENTGCAA